MNGLSRYYSTDGPLGWLTPLAALVLNVVGVGLGLGLTWLLKKLASPSYDLYKLPVPATESTIDLLMGHARYLLKPNYHRTLLRWANEYGPMFRIRILTEWTVVITDPAAAAQVLSSVPGRTHNYQRIDEVLGGPGVISMFGTLDEEQWRGMRKATAPAFSMANVRRYYGGLVAAAGELLSAADADQAALGCVDLEPLLQRLMIRATLEGLFEVPDATKVPGFDRLVPNINLLMAEANRQITDPIRAALYARQLAPLLSKHVAACRRALKETVAFHTNTAARLLARPEPAADNTLLWACLHRLRHPRTARRLSPAQLHPQVGMYTTAGFDTTAATIGWCMYAAALHPEEADAVAAELRTAGAFGPGAVLEGGDDDRDGGDSAGGGGGAVRHRVRLSYGRCPGVEELARLPRLNAFVSEVMRLYGVTALSAERVSSEPLTLMGRVLPPGVVLWPMSYGIHMSDANWEEPEAFRPERWLQNKQCAFAKQAQQQQQQEQEQPEQKVQQQSQKGQQGRQGRLQQQPKGAAGTSGGTAVGDGAAPLRRFIPFGDGPKNCVGQNFGITVVRATLALLLSRYRPRLHPDMGLGGSADTEALTSVGVITKLSRLVLVLERRGQEGRGS